MVSPVEVFLRPIAAIISPAQASLTRSLLFECILRSLETFFFFLIVSVIYVFPGLDFAGIDSDISNFSSFVQHYLKCEGRERVFCIASTRFNSIGFRIDAFDGGKVLG